MPPSVPPPGGANDASTGGATTRLPLIRETSRNPKKFNNKPSSRSAMKSTTTTTTQRLSSATRKGDMNRSRSNLLLRNNNRKKVNFRKNQPKSGRTPAPAPSQRSTITEVENDSDNGSNNIEPSLNGVPASSASPLDTTGLAPYGGVGAVSPYGFYGGGASMMPPSPFMGMGGMGMNGMGGGLPYLSGLNQMVYNVQNIIFSISQAIQVVGTNQQALQHAWESLNQMVDHAVVTFHEMRALESIERECETEEERSKRKRLKALRYAFVFGGGWLAYKLIRNLLFRKRSLPLRQYGQSSNLDTLSQQMASPSSTAMSNYSSPNNFHGAMNMGYPGYSSTYHGLGNGYY